MFVLDTNVLSELGSPRGSEAVVAWINNIRREHLFTTAVSQAVLLYGIAISPKGRKKSDLSVQADSMFARDFAGRVLPFDSRAAAHFADILATRRRSGRRIEPIDGQIAAIARAHGMTIVTRDVSDFEQCGIDIVNPWDA